MERQEYINEKEMDLIRNLQVIEVEERKAKTKQTTSKKKFQKKEHGGLELAESFQILSNAIPKEYKCCKDSFHGIDFYFIYSLILIFIYHFSNDSFFFFKKKR